MALTEDQKKTIRLARQAYKNMLENQLLPLLGEFADYERQILKLHEGAPWAPKPPKPQVPEVDPMEQKALQEVLAEATRKETK